MRFTKKDKQMILKAINQVKEYNKQWDNLYGKVDKFFKINSDLSFEMPKLKIPLSDEDLQQLQNGETFDWCFRGVDVHLYSAEEDEVIDDE